MTADGSYDLPGQGLVRACARIQDAKPEKSVSGKENPTGRKRAVAFIDFEAGMVFAGGDSAMLTPAQCRLLWSIGRQQRFKSLVELSEWEDPTDLLPLNTIVARIHRLRCCLRGLPLKVITNGHRGYSLNMPLEWERVAARALARIAA